MAISNRKIWGGMLVGYTSSSLVLACTTKYYSFNFGEKGILPQCYLSYFHYFSFLFLFISPFHRVINFPIFLFLPRFN